MYHNSMFFVYIFAELTGFLIIAAIAIFFRSQSKHSARLAYIRNIIICYFIIGFIYIISNYYSIIINEYKAGPIIRILDTSAWLVSKYYWFIFAQSVLVVQDKYKVLLRKALTYIFIPLLVLSVINYGCIMDDYYYVQSGFLQDYVYAVQRVRTTIIMLFLVAHMIAVLIKSKEKTTAVFVTVNTLFYIINGAWNGLAGTELIRGDILLTEWSELVDPTAIILLLTNLTTLIYIAKCYFNTTSSSSEEESVDAVVQQYSLTHREAEIIARAYNGESNNEIAEALCISIYTVKRHLQNAYEKMDVSTRMELIKLIKKYRAKE